MRAVHRAPVAHPHEPKHGLPVATVTLAIAMTCDAQCVPLRRRGNTSFEPVALVGYGARSVGGGGDGFRTRLPLHPLSCSHFPNSCFRTHEMKCPCVFVGLFPRAGGLSESAFAVVFGATGRSGVEGLSAASSG